MRTIHTVVFSAGEGGGNPCPVTLDADTLSSAQMQEMARGFGEESAFLTWSGKEDCAFRARYFVPLHEMEMCVHATIGSATVLIQEGLVSESPFYLETDLGPLLIEWARDGDAIDVSVEQFRPVFADCAADAREVCRALGISADELAESPIQAVSTSRFKLMIPLKSRGTLDRLTPDFPLLWDLCDRYAASGFYPFALGKDNMGADVIYARQFPKRAGYNEDAATGLAASSVASYLAHHKILGGNEGWNGYTVYQGFAMGRPSVLYAGVLMEGREITRTRVRGRAARVER